MSLKRIHVNQHIIKANKKNGTNDPPITVKVGRQNIRAHIVRILGPSQILHMAHRPLKCGAKVWIETTADIQIYDGIQLMENNF